MKSVMLSIKPQYCELIVIGKKTVEVRKTKSKIDVPFKCHMYCTKSPFELVKDKNGNITLLSRNKKADITDLEMLSGKVIGEFVCDRVYDFGKNIANDKWALLSGSTHNWHKRLIVQCAMLNEEETHEYANGKTLYGWHISDLVIYDKPRELSEFKSRQYVWRGNNHIHIYEEMKRPPQSWCYVEELG